MKPVATEYNKLERNFQLGFNWTLLIPSVSLASCRALRLLAGVWERPIIGVRVGVGGGRDAFGLGLIPAAPKDGSLADFAF